MKKLILLVLMLPIVAIADSQSWLKKDNPNELYALIAIEGEGKCSISYKELHATVNGVLVRSRIKPLLAWTSNEVSLLVHLNCFSGTGKTQIYVAKIQLSRFSVHESGVNLVTTSLEDSFGFFGNDTKDGILSSVREGVEGAITVYLKANFDLGEDE